MKSYIFYVEGLEQELTVQADSIKHARTKVWDQLTDSEKDRVVQFELIDIIEGYYETM